ncbi:MAG TPA: hypothetical protein VGC38_00120 [Pseudolabrys sp.]
MRKILILCAFGAGLFVPGLALADDPAPAPVQAAAAPADAAANSGDDKQVCRREHITGSLFNGPTICKSAKDWAVQHQDSTDYVNKQTSIDLQMNPPGH